MGVYRISRKETDYFSTLNTQLSNTQQELSSFIGFENEIENFQKQIELKRPNYSNETRQVLCASLQSQYAHLSHSKALDSIELLKDEKTFTVCTGHQLSLLTGPAYFIYKILHTIQLSRVLKEKYPGYNFVPVYWMASEDHDIDEIRSLHIFNNNIQWDTAEEGAVGRISMSGLQEILEEFKGYFSEEKLIEIDEIFSKNRYSTYGSFFFDLVTNLFKEYELVVLDADNIQLKKLFKPLIFKDLNNSFSFNCLNKTNRELQKKEIKLQVKPREINLFYLSKNKRSRIIKNGDLFEIDDVHYSLDDLLNLLEKEPHNFSPNVVLRPLFQEYILPNLSYVGGAGELAYWIQLKGIFEEAKIPYPILQLRSSIFFWDEKSLHKWQSLGLSLSDLFKNKENLVSDFAKAKMKDEIDTQSIEEKFEGLTKELQQASKGNLNLSQWMGAEISRMEKQLQNIQGKLKKEAKQKNESDIAWIEKQKERLFPNNSMQERKANFFHFCPDGKVQDKMKFVLNFIDPFNPDIVLLTI